MNYFNAIVFFKKELNKTPFKYRNIKDKENFKRFCENKIENCDYFNLYDKQTKQFVERIYIK
jgi:hypothetical protein